jgi:hypothetical protein
MKIFDIKDAQVIVNPEILVIPAFYEVWKNERELLNSVFSDLFTDFERVSKGQTKLSMF